MQNFSFFAQFENILCLISSHRFAFKMLKNGIIIGSDHETICQDKLVTGQDQEIEYWNSKRTGPENGIMRQTSMHALCIARDSRCLPDVCLIIRLPRYHIPCPYTACPNIRSWIFLFHVRFDIIGVLFIRKDSMQIGINGQIVYDVLTVSAMLVLRA